MMKRLKMLLFLLGLFLGLVFTNSIIYSNICEANNNELVENNRKDNNEEKDEGKSIKDDIDINVNIINKKIQLKEETIELSNEAKERLKQQLKNKIEKVKQDIQKQYSKESENEPVDITLEDIKIKIQPIKIDQSEYNKIINNKELSSEEKKEKIKELYLKEFNKKNKTENKIQIQSNQHILSNIIKEINDYNKYTITNKEKIFEKDGIEYYLLNVKYKGYNNIERDNIAIQKKTEKEELTYFNYAIYKYNQDTQKYEIIKNKDEDYEFYKVFINYKINSLKNLFNNDEKVLPLIVYEKEENTKSAVYIINFNCFFSLLLYHNVIMNEILKKDKNIYVYINRNIQRNNSNINNNENLIHLYCYEDMDKRVEVINAYVNKYINIIKTVKDKEQQKKEIEQLKLEIDKDKCQKINHNQLVKRIQQNDAFWNYIMTVPVSVYIDKTSNKIENIIVGASKK